MNEHYDVKKNYFGIDISWNRVLNFMYKNNEKLQVIQSNLWIKIKKFGIWIKQNDSMRLTLINLKIGNVVVATEVLLYVNLMDQ